MYTERRLRKLEALSQVKADSERWHPPGDATLFHPDRKEPEGYEDCRFWYHEENFRKHEHELNLGMGGSFVMFCPLHPRGPRSVGMGCGHDDFVKPCSTCRWFDIKPPNETGGEMFMPFRF